MKKIYRYEVPVDDQWHDLELFGIILHVASRSADTVEVWAVREEGGLHTFSTVRVFGTGHPYPDDGEWLGTALAPHGLVWHLIEIPRSSPDHPDGR